MKPGVFCFNPPCGVRIGAEHGDELLALYSDMGRALALPRLARGLFRRQPELCGGLLSRADHDETCEHADLRGAFLVFQL